MGNIILRCIYLWVFLFKAWNHLYIHTFEASLVLADFHAFWFKEIFKNVVWNIACIVPFCIKIHQNVIVMRRTNLVIWELLCIPPTCSESIFRCIRRMVQIYQRWSFRVFFFFWQPFDKCFLGSAPSADKERTFAGQMSSVYLFSEALTPQQVAGMYLLGPNYKVKFSTKNVSRCKKWSYI